MIGAPVDIISGMPLDGPGRARTHGDDAASLIDKMRMAGLPHSEAGAIVRQRVLGVLEKKIATILNEDVQVKICIEILKAIEAPAIVAAEHARRYLRRQNLSMPALDFDTTPEKEEPYP
jgi:hypothetical protein